MLAPARRRWCAPLVEKSAITYVAVVRNPPYLHRRAPVLSITWCLAAGRPALHRTRCQASRFAVDGFCGARATSSPPRRHKEEIGEAVEVNCNCGRKLAMGGDGYHAALSASRDCARNMQLCRA